jgi:hypothetical protein
MRRLLTMTVVAVTQVGVMPGAALAGSPVWHFEGDHQPGDVIESTSETKFLPVDRTDRVPAPATPPVTFDRLWLAVVRPVGLLLVVRTVLTESRWPWRPAPDRISRNGSGLGDVITDE